jgi:hypothetical protein
MGYDPFIDPQTDSQGQSSLIIAAMTLHSARNSFRVPKWVATR